MSLTIRRWLRDTVDRLNQAQVDSPAATARALLATALNQSHTWLVAHDEAELDSTTQARLEQSVVRVIDHEPLTYILGHREFYGIDLLVDARALIPRPETEMLVETALVHVSGVPGTENHVTPVAYDVIDVGTGSGAIAVAISTHAPGARILATDISQDALALAEQNARRCGVQDRIDFVASDLLDAIDTRARCITANLPYVSVEEIEALPPEIQEHEPRIALDGGRDGLALVRRLLAQLDSHLEAGGIAVFEIGASQGPDALAAARLILPGWSVEMRPDLAKLDRMLMIRKPNA